MRVVFPPPQTKGAAVLAAGVCAAFGAGAASAATPAPPPPVSAISQYVEMVPTSGGDVATGAKGNRSLPKTITKRIDEFAGSTATPLEKIATSATYGAPQQRLRRTRLAVGSSSSPISTVITSASLSAAATTVVGDGSNVSSLLLGAMVATLLTGGAVAFRRRVLHSHEPRGAKAQQDRWPGER